MIHYLKKSYERYINIWQNFNKYIVKSNKSDFWTFLIINYLVFICISSIMFLIDWYLLINICQLIFIVITISIGIGRMNDIKKPVYLLFVPFYNLYLLAQDSVIEIEDSKVIQKEISSVEDLVRPNKIIKKKLSFLKSILVAVLIGVFNLVITLFYAENVCNNMYVAFIVMALGALVTFLAFVGIIIIDTNLKKGFSEDQLMLFTFLSAIVFTIITCLVTYLVCQ